MHHAHCLEIYVKEGDQVKEGQLVAKIGKSGTDYSHDHWACKNQPTGIDGIAKTQEDLVKWQDPVEFVKKWSGIISEPPMEITNQTKIPQINGWEVQKIKSEIDRIPGLDQDLKNTQKERDNYKKANDLQAELILSKDKEIEELTKQLSQTPNLPPNSDLKDYSVSQLIKEILSRFGIK